MVNHANLLLQQIINTPRTRYLLFPNQHIGAWYVSFMPQWISREYIARRGQAKFRPDHLKPARCPLLGFVPSSLLVDGARIARWFIEVDLQKEVGDEGYDKGAQIIYNFVKKELQKFLTDELDNIGKQIIECALDNGSLDDYLKIIPMTY